MKYAQAKESSDTLDPDVIEHLKSFLVKTYEPVTDPTKADHHLSTHALYGKFQRIYPGTGYTPADIATMLTEFGFVFCDYGDMLLEWMLKDKERLD